MVNVKFSYVSVNGLTGGCDVYDRRKKLLPEFALWVEDGEGNLAEFDPLRARKRIRAACAEAYPSDENGRAGKVAEAASGCLLDGIARERAAGILPLNGTLSRESLKIVAARGRVIPNSEMRARIAMSLLMEDGRAWEAYLGMAGEEGA